MSTELSLEGTEQITQLIRELERLPQEVDKEMRPVMQAAGETLRQYVATYPAATGANSPPGLNDYSWYERGFGTRTVTGRAYPTSEVLGRSWTVAVKQLAMRGWQAIIGTNVSYSRFVQDKEKQARFHAARGWPTIQDAVAQKGSAVISFIEKAIDRVIAKVSKM